MSYNKSVIMDHDVREKEHIVHNNKAEDGGYIGFKRVNSMQIANK